MLLARRFFSHAARRLAVKTVNSVTLVGVAHDLQSGFVYEDSVTQFTLTTTSIDNTSGQDCVVEKDHHTVRCFGDQFSAEMKNEVKEGNVVCVNGRLRLNPQLEPSCNKHFYFPYVHVQPPHGSVCIVHADRTKPPDDAPEKQDEVPAEDKPEQPAADGATAPTEEAPKETAAQLTDAAAK